MLSSFNLLLILQGRAHVRQVLLLLAGNAVVLAVFGTFQKLAGSPGLWFGAVKSPNEHFFATFIYHNHWGAFTLLNIGACLALLFHYHRRGGYRDIWHSPVLLGVVLTLLLATSIPLSTSRSCTVLAGLLLAGALIHLLLRVIRQRREHRQSAAAPAAAIVLAALLATGGVAYLPRTGCHRPAFPADLGATHTPRGGGHAYPRASCFIATTWHMSAEKPWLGWGLESYARVFRVFNTQRTTESVFWIPYYAEAHNDWLQSWPRLALSGPGCWSCSGFCPWSG